MSLKELEQLTEELKQLIEQLRGERNQQSRMTLMAHFQKLLIRFQQEVHG